MTSTKQDKVLIALGADQDLEQMINEVNTGFTGGRVTKVQLLTWLIPYFKKHCFADCIELIRKAHFDKLAHLKAVVKQVAEAKRAGQEIPDIEALIAPAFAISGHGLRSKKASAKPPKRDQENKE